MNTATAAALAGVSEATIRKWRQRGYLPDEPDAVDVWRCVADRIPKREHAEMDAIWAEVKRAEP